MPSWYEIKAKANESDTLDLSIHDEIGHYGVSGRQFVAEFKAKRGNATKAELSICSPGGSVFDGWLIFNTLKNSGLKITTKNLGIAASMASVLMMLGEVREAPANTMMMVHNAISGLYGDADDFREVAGTLDKIDNGIVNTYVAATGKDEKTVRDLMNKDTFMTAAEALELGFLSKVTDPIEAKASFAIDSLPANVQALFKAKNSANPANSAAGTVLQTPAGTVVTPFAEQVRAMAEAAGLGEFAAHFALSVVSLEGARDRIMRAADIKAYCALAKLDAEAAAFIRNDKPVADVRKHLMEALAKQDENSVIDTTPAAAGTTSASGKGLDVNAIYNRRNNRAKQTQGKAAA